MGLTLAHLPAHAHRLDRRTDVTDLVTSNLSTRVVLDSFEGEGREYRHPAAIQAAMVSPMWPFLIVAAIVLVAVFTVNRKVGRGAAVIICLLAAVLLAPWPIMFAALTFRIPGFFQNVAIVWPQLVFFGPALHKTGTAWAPVLPSHWAYTGTVAFWMLAAVIFGIAAQRIASLWLLSVAGCAFVVAIVYAVGWIVPPLGWRLFLDFP